MDKYSVFKHFRADILSLLNISNFKIIGSSMGIQKMSNFLNFSLLNFKLVIFLECSGYYIPITLTKRNSNKGEFKNIYSVPILKRLNSNPVLVPPVYMLFNDFKHLIPDSFHNG